MLATAAVDSNWLSEAAVHPDSFLASLKRADRCECDVTAGEKGAVVLRTVEAHTEC